MAIITVSNPPIETGVINALSEWNGLRVNVPLPKWVKPYNNNKISKESESDKPLVPSTMFRGTRCSHLLVLIEP